MNKPALAYSLKIAAVFDLLAEVSFSDNVGARKVRKI